MLALLAVLLLLILVFVLAEVLTYVKSQKGKNMLKHDGYLFVQEKVIVDKTIWRCELYAKKKCTARCHTQNGEVVHFISEHNHAVDVAKVKAREAMLEIKGQATTSQSTTRNVLSNVSISLSQAVQGQMPQVDSIIRTIQRTRQQEGRAPPTPSNLRELVIPVIYENTSLGVKFLQFDSGNADDRILIFATIDNLDRLASCNHWYADGTFKSTPPLFAQVYAIHGLKYNKVIPSVFALLPNKTEATYDRLLAALKSLRPSLNPETVMTDFEMAFINAFRQNFPTSKQRGCFFHLSQCIWRCCQSHRKILEEYKSSPDFALQVRMLLALSFVPPSEVINYFEELVENIILDNSEVLRPLLDYFEDTWIGRPTGTRNRRRRSPMYKIDLWNCYDAVKDGLAKTNNSCEGWHNAFNNHLCVNHPTIWKFIDVLKKEQSIVDLKVTNLLSGGAPRPSRKKYLDSAQCIENVVKDFGNRTVNEYLLGIANNISF
jgi:hypothetical protein